LLFTSESSIQRQIQEGDATTNSLETEHEGKKGDEADEEYCDDTDVNSECEEGDADVEGDGRYDTETDEMTNRDRSHGCENFKF